MKHKINREHDSISINSHESGLDVNIITSRLTIRSIRQDDSNHCLTLFSDPTVMEKYASGKPYEEEVIKDKFLRWVTRFSNHDPYSVYALIENYSENFVGVIGIGHASIGKSDVFYAMHPQFWGKGYGSEIVNTVVLLLIPRLMISGYHCAGAPLTTLEADTHLNNIASQIILRNVGFEKTKQIDKFDMSRSFFELNASKVKSDYHKFFAQRDMKRYLEEERRNFDDNADVSAEEMARSAFGQGKR